jgi:prolyl oligopeptidase family protein
MKWIARSWRSFPIVTLLVLAPWATVQAAGAPPKLVLPNTENFTVNGRPAFVFLPPAEKRAMPTPWIFYAPTLAGYPDEAERWMHEQFLAAGIAVAGVDVGEAYGSPKSHAVFDALYRELTEKRGFASRPCLFGRSRGGLWVSSWAIANPMRVAGIIGIYPVFDFRTYPGTTNAAPAYGLTPAELQARAAEFNPIERIEVLARAGVPAALIHGNVDKVVPLKENSAEFVRRYKEAGAESLVKLIVLEGQGHSFFKGFFQSQELVNFAITRARTGAGEAAGIPAAKSSGLRLGTFDIDATPPVGSHMAYDPVTNKWDLGLRARGVMLLGAGEPIVLCAVDWIGIANEGHDAFRKALASALGTRPDRIAVHTLHQHDAPDCDFSAERILQEAGMDTRQYEGTFQRQVISNLAVAVRGALLRAQPLTHLGLGEASVDKVASNRRVFGPDGKVRAVRYTACSDPDLRAAPEGTIDPVLSQVSFWNGDKPLAVLSYYATHPQSYYRTGIPNPDFPGVARFQRDLAVASALHVHFNGAGGNIGAGKYNDGAPTNRLSLAERLADGMRRAWENTKREPLDTGAVSWVVESVALPPSKYLEKLEIKAQADASRLAWVRRCQAGHKIDVTCLKLGRARILHLPGELFVEYQLAAKAQRPDLFVAMAAYGDYAPWYIGTAVAYEEGGYETEPRSSNVSPEVESVLMGAIRKLLGD